MINRWLLIILILTLSSCSGKNPVSIEKDNQRLIGRIGENVTGAPNIAFVRASVVNDTVVIDVKFSSIVIPTPNNWCSQIHFNTDMNGIPEFGTTSKCLETGPQGNGYEYVRKYYPSDPNAPLGWGSITGLATIRKGQGRAYIVRVPTSALGKSFNTPCKIEVYSMTDTHMFQSYGVTILH